jgi:hypothetical protein
VEQSWHNARAKTLRFPACARKHRSIDLRFSFARGARHSRKLQGGSNSRVAIPLTKRLFFQAFLSGIVTASPDTFITKNIFRPAKPAHLLTHCPLPTARCPPPTTHRPLPMQASQMSSESPTDEIANRPKSEKHGTFGKLGCINVRRDESAPEPETAKAWKSKIESK